MLQARSAIAVFRVSRNHWETSLKEHSSNATPVELLLIDDDEKDIFLAERAFKKGAIASRTQTAKNGEEGLALLRREPPFEDAVRPDIIFLDLNMPRMTGYEFLDIVKADIDFKSIPVIVMTNSQSDADMAKCYGNHANAFIAKPIELGDFMSAIQAVESFWFKAAKLPQTRRA